MSDINTLMESLSKFNGKWPYQDAAEQLIKQQAEITTLREQVEKLTKERNAFQDQCIRLKNERAVENGQLAALAEQNEKFRETLSRWRYQNLSYNWCCGNCGAVDGDGHKEGCALSLPDLATIILNKEEGE